MNQTANQIQRAHSATRFPLHMQHYNEPLRTSLVIVLCAAVGAAGLFRGQLTGVVAHEHGRDFKPRLRRAITPHRKKRIRIFRVVVNHHHSHRTHFQSAADLVHEVHPAVYDHCHVAFYLVAILDVTIRLLWYHPHTAFAFEQPLVQLAG